MEVRRRRNRRPAPLLRRRVLKFCKILICTTSNRSPIISRNLGFGAMKRIVIVDHVVHRWPSRTCVDRQVRSCQLSSDLRVVTVDFRFLHPCRRRADNWFRTFRDPRVKKQDVWTNYIIYSSIKRPLR
ncbi:unnamed protein product, partial [Nesidiocoris tenuis]